IYRIAIHEASNQRRWWFRHKRREASMETPTLQQENGEALTIEDTLVDGHESPFEHCIHAEVKARVEAELQQGAEPYRTAVVLRDIEGFRYEEMGGILEVSLGTVKSRLMRGRNALRKRLAPFAEHMADELGLEKTGKKKEAEEEVPR